MYKDYKSGLMFESLKDAIPAKKLKFGGTIKSRSTIKVGKTPARYGGSVNISKQLKLQAEEIFQNELIPLQTMIFAKQQQQIAQGKGSRIPAKYHKAMDNVKKKISALKMEAKIMDGLQ